MIIRRLAENIKNQDWFVVSIEVMVVVIGIFIGLQVDDWNNAQNDDLRATEVLEELNQDFIVIDQTAKNLAEYYLNIVSDMEVMLDSLAAQKVLPKDEQAIKNAITLGGKFGDPPPPSGIFRELVSSGTLSFIHNKDLRLRLMEYDQSISIIVGSDLNININLSAFIVAFNRHVKFGTNYHIPEGADLAFVDVILPSVTEFDFYAMVNDQEFRVAAEQHHAAILSRYVNIRVAQSKIAQIRQLISESTKDPSD